jgi:UTP--glucose-1-phosphate uridylyltransferase
MDVSVEHPIVRTAVVPAAGLGTRLLPATLVRSKELLPLGLHPAFFATLLEAQAAGLEELIVAMSPGKDDLARLLRPETWGAAGEGPALDGLRALLGRLRVRLCEQPRPDGVLDAISRGLALAPGERAWAILYPDLVHLPDQRGLRTLQAAYAACGRAVYGLYEAGGTGGRHGPSARVRVAGPDGPLRPGEVRRIEQVAPPGAPGEPGLRTTFGTIHTRELSEVLERSARPAPGLPLSDGMLIEALNALCARGGLYGVMMPGEVLDLGHPAGYLDAARRFASGEARLRGGI